MKKRILSLLLTLSLLVGLLPTAAVAAEAEHPFADVTAKDWFSEAVTFVYQKGLMSGTGKNTFSPYDTATRGMIVTILHRLEGCPTEAPADFPDVADGAYYAPAVAWAVKNKIVNGCDTGIFAPDEPVTRQQLAAILYRYVLYKGHSASAVGDLSAFRDARRVSTWAWDAMGWAVGAGLITGVGSDTLDPDGSADRGQTAMLLMRLCQLLDEKKDTTPVVPGASGGSSGGSSGSSGSSGGSSGDSSGGGEDTSTGGDVKPYTSSILGMALEEDRAKLTVTLRTETGGILHFSFLQEDKTPIGQGTVPVEKDERSAEYPLSEELKGALPDSFLIVAQLKDESGNALTIPFTCLDYTKKYKSFLEKRYDDSAFQGQIVQRFGDDSSDATKNFAVLSKGIVDISAEATLESDAENPYTFSGLSGVKAGDRLYYLGENGEQLLLKVASVTTKDGKTVITPDTDAALSDFYDLIKMDMDVDLSSPASAAGTPAIAQYALRAEDGAGRGRSANGTATPYVDITGGTSLSSGVKATEFGSVSASGSVKVHLKMIYSSNLGPSEEEYYLCNLTCDLGLSLAVAISDKARADATLPIFDIPVVIPNSPIGNVHFKLTLPASVSAEVGGSYTMISSLTSGVCYNTIDGYQCIQDKSSNCTNLNLKGGLNSSVGVAFTVSASSLMDFVSVSAGAEGGLSFSGQAQSGTLAGTQSASRHACDLCFTGTCSTYFKLPFKLSYKITKTLKGDAFSLNLIDAKAVFSKFYISIDDGGSFPEGYQHCGWNDCPNKNYLISFDTYNNSSRVDGCTVTVKDKAGKTVAEKKSPFEIYLAPGQYTATGTVGTNYASKTFTVSKAAEINLHAKDSVFFGQVTDQATGTAIAGAKVTVTTAETPPTVVATLTTDESGMYQTTVPNGAYRVSASAENYDASELLNVTVDIRVNDQEDQRRTRKDLTLKKKDTTGTMTFTVVDEKAKPIAGANVSVFDAQGESVFSGATDAQGQLTTTALEAGSYRYSVSASSKYSTKSGSADVTAKNDTPVSVTLKQETGTLSGTVQSDEEDSPVLEGVTVALLYNNQSYDTTTTDANGAYKFEKLPVGVYTVKFSKTNYSGVTKDAIITKNSTYTLNATLKKLTASGVCGKQGDNLIWTLSEDGVLTISGTGEMKLYYRYSDTYNPNYPSAPWSEYKSQIKSVVLEEGMTNISSYTFDSTGITSITIPSSVERIGWSAFSFCQSLSSVTFSEGLTEIGTSAFQRCDSLTSITLPSSVQRIEEKAFYLCKNLTSVTLSKDLKSIGQDAFYGCEKLTNVSFPKGLTSIGQKAFYGCKTFTEIILPEGVTSIDDLAFANCTKVKTLVLPEGLTSLNGSDVFANLRNLQTVYWPKSLTTQRAGTIVRYPGFSFTIYYAGSEEEWKNVQQNLPEHEIVYNSPYSYPGSST